MRGLRFQYAWNVIYSLALGSLHEYMAVDLPGILRVCSVRAQRWTELGTARKKIDDSP